MGLAIKQLEEVTGRQGIDTALIGDILAKAYDRAGQLGLDPDFNGKELYQSLINRIKEDNLRVSKLIGSTNPNDVEKICRLAMRRVSRMRLHKEGWFLKTKVAKRLLRNTHPPILLSG